MSNRWLNAAIAVASLAASATAENIALANTEPAAAYDARSVALGGTGAAYIHNGSSIYHNPAALEGIGTLALTGVISPSKPGMTVPLNGPDTEVTSDATLFPMFLVGGGYRLSKRLVVGIAVFPSAGFGSVYKNVETAAGPVDLQQKVMMLEATPSLSFALFDGLALGVGYRIMYTTQSAEQIVPLPGPPGPPTFGKMKIELSGMGFSSFHFGLFAHPAKDTRLAVTYRNRFSTKLDGTVTSGGVSADASTELSMPHMVRLGVAQGLFDSRLLLVADVRRALYAEVGKELVTTVDFPQGRQEMVMPLNWRSTWTFGAGAEYTFPGDIAARAGYSATQSASSESTPSYYMPAPVLLHTIHAGGGLRIGSFDIDAGGYYSFGGTTLNPPQESPASPNPGRYETTFLMGSLSLTYRM